MALQTSHRTQWPSGGGHYAHRSKFPPPIAASSSCSRAGSIFTRTRHLIPSIAFPIDLLASRRANSPLSYTRVGSSHVLDFGQSIFSRPSRASWRGWRYRVHRLCQAIGGSAGGGARDEFLPLIEKPFRYTQGNGEYRRRRRSRSVHIAT